MTSLAETLSFVVTTLQTWSLCLDVRVLETHQFSARQFALKVRAELVSGMTLQVRLYCNNTHIDYAYQLFQGHTPMVRWDNKEHFPSLATFPHHLHTATGRVEASPLIGSPTQDLPYIIQCLGVMLA